MVDTPTLVSYLYTSAYALPVLVAIAWMIVRKRNTWAQNRAVLEDNVKAGLTEPASLHPVVDPTLCIGCGVCVPACPEGDVLGLIDGKVQLINPTSCIGHAACKAACPTDAITLVFGTAKRGVDIPLVNDLFETTVPGIYIAGELGGMGLVRNAIKQGREAIEAIARRDDVKAKRSDVWDVLIVGAGPAGLAATLTAQQLGLRYVTVEQECLGGNVAHFPRGKLVMTAPFELPGVGTFNFREISKEELLEVWRLAEAQSGVRINYKEKMDSIVATEGGFQVKTSKRMYHTRTVLLAIGRRGTPRKLGVPGEEGSTKVVYSLTDASLYQGKKVLVVGGGNSALEAATSIAAEPGTEVVLSYRSETFTRAAKKNRDLLAEAERDGRVKVALKSVVKEIKPESVILEHEGESYELVNDAVIISAGGVLPTPFLKELGILVETKFGTV